MSIVLCDIIITFDVTLPYHNTHNYKKIKCHSIGLQVSIIIILQFYLTNFTRFTAILMYKYYLVFYC